MKKFIILLTILSMVVIMFSCKLRDDGTTPVEPETKTLTVTSPKSGDSLFTTSVFDIKWTSNTTQKLIIEYTIDNGITWNLIVSSIDNSQSYLWSPVPSTLTAQGRVRITTLDSTLSATNEGFFSIVRGTSKILQIAEPNGGENWQSSSNQAIKWISSGVDSVILDYTLDNGLNWINITSNAPSTGFYNWNPLPSSATTIAKVRIADAAEGFPIDESDGVFTIEPEDILTLTMPNGGEEWLAGSSQYIKWDTKLNIIPAAALPTPMYDEIGSAKLSGKNLTSRLGKGSKPVIKSGSPTKSIATVENVKIEYSVNGGANWFTIIANSPNNGIYFWSSLPNENSAQCLIRVSDAVDGVPFDYNDASFSIFTSLPQEIEILSPNGGENWAAGTSQEIRWSSKDVSFVKIEYTIDNGVNWVTIVESTLSDGFYTWEQLPTGAATNCRIKISDAADGSPSDMSNDLFSITPEPSIDLTSPNGGETLQSGSSINITWTSENIAQIKIEYTINGGAEWLLIADNVESTGTYTWENIPDVNSSQVRVKISDADDGAPSDISESNLSISNQIVQSLEVTAPNGNEFWEANTSKNITWNSSAVTHVKIEFTSNNGLDWAVVEDSLPSSGSYDWTVPNVNSTQAKIRISDAVDGDPIDESNATFRIKQAGTLKLINPKSGDNWVAGDLNRIEWEADNVEKVKIEFTTTNAIYDPTAEWFDDAWFNLITNAPGAAGFYETRFTIPSTEYRLRISDAEFDEPIDFSGLFTVKGQPSYTLQVTAPNGGENWIIGEPYEITWVSENVERVSIDYSLNNGTTWNSIVSDVISNGLLNWVVPDIGSRSDLCKIRVVNSSDSTIFDLSDSPFSIHASEKLLRVVSPNGGENLESGVPTRIEWTSAGVENIDMFFTIDNTNTWYEIISNYKSTGAYMWTPPDTSSSLARIKVVDSDDPSIQDESDSYFNINNINDGEIQIITPNGGESLLANTSATIRWTSSNVSNVKIEYSQNNGADWVTVVESTPSNGSYQWASVPNIYSELCAVRISDVNRSDIKSVSASTFTITNLIVQSIDITSPNGGELWEAGTSKNITWNSSAVTHVKIEFTSNNGLDWTVIENNLASSGSYDWSVPNVNSTQAKIRISDAVDGDPVDESNSTFKIKQAGTLQLTNPQSSEVWIAGELNRIEWISANVEKVKIEFTTSNAVYDPTSINFYDEWFDLVTNAPAAAGFYETRFTIPSTEYRLRISDAEFDEPVDFSGLFTVKEQPSFSLTLTTPNGGENWLIGEPYEITWTSENVERVSIDYSLNNGTTWNNIVSDVVSNGLLNWIVPNIANRSDLCKIRIQHVSDSTIFDLSDGAFSIHAEDKLLRVVSPNGGENLESGVPTRVEWTSTGVENVDIFFTLDNAVSWSEVISGLKSTGAYMWTPPDTSSSLSRIKIVDSDDDSIKDESDSYFNIHKANDGVVLVLYPNGGEQLNAGGSADIKWQTQNVQNIKIEYSHNNGANWVTLIESTPTDPGFYNWNPVPLTQTSHGVIRISDASRSDINDVSNSTFIINNSNVITQEIEITTPNGGENWVAGETHPISWTSSNIDNVSVEYSVDNGNSWQAIFIDYPNTGSIQWIIPDEATTSAMVRVKDAYDSDPLDMSDNVFVIKSLPTIQLISPNGGEILTEGSKVPIRWSSQFVQDVRIEFSPNNGGSWTELVASTPSDGSWTWDPIPAEYSDLCAIKVSDAERNDIFTISASTFSIEEKIDQISGEPSSIYLVTQSLYSIGVTESGSPETAQITFEVQDSSGVPINIAHAVDVNFKFGAQPNGGEFLAPTTVRTDANGQATVNLTSGTIAGAVQVIAEISYNGDIIRSRPVNIAIHGGLPELGHFTVAPEWLNYPFWYVVTEDEVKISALVGDRYSNPVREETVVYFNTESGVIDGSGLTNDNGFASVFMHSGNPWPNDPVDGPGFFYVHANTIDENDADISTKVRVLFSGAPQLTLSPLTFDIPNGGTQSFTYTVMDVNGNPLAHDNEYKVQLITEGDVAVGGSGALVVMPDVQTGNMTFTFTVYDTKPNDDKLENIIVKVNVAGPNGSVSTSVSGTTR
ncbi:MAG: hypothetical protein L3J41_11400 [Melioribacteraceae bacterium]|nr:hypothetical protein [Melioribacteraceae bacterium]